MNVPLDLGIEARRAVADELLPPDAAGMVVSSYDPEALLRELEPEAGRLLERHLGVATEWFPHEMVPYGEGRDFAREPWTPDHPRLSGVARTAFEVNHQTEDNQPSYHRLI